MSKVCPHFHLSLQSGCDTTLERMNRRYRSAEYKARCELLRKYFGNPALTTDVIVGFPMETEEDFQASYDFVKDIHFYETHIFKYSRRHGTKAAAMSGQLTEAEKAVRSDKMLELHQKILAPVRVGDTIEAVVEVTEIRPTSKSGRAVVTSRIDVFNHQGVMVMPYTATRLLAGRS